MKNEQCTMLMAMYTQRRRLPPIISGPRSAPIDHRRCTTPSYDKASLHFWLFFVPDENVSNAGVRS